MAIELGSAYVTVIPEMKGAQAAIGRALGDKSMGSAAGASVGNAMGASLKDAVGKAFKVIATSAAVKKVFDFGKAAFDGYSEFEQLAGGAAKIFDEMDQSKILEDASGAWKTLNMSANEYLSAINQTGAMFAQTMGDEKGYETAQKGMQAISDYATGTGRDINELNEKFGMITRSTGSYQSIADQFAGILPATSKDFLEQAQAAGLLSESYEKLTDVPVAEYQEAVAGMLEKGTADLGLAGNTAKESLTTLSGSVLATKSAWSNFVTEVGKGGGDLSARMADLAEAGGAAGRLILERVGIIARTMMGLVGDAITTAVGRIATDGPAAVASAMQSIGSALGDAVANLADFNGGGFDSWFANLLGSAKDIADGVGSFVGSVGDSIRSNWPTIQANLSALWGEAVSFVQTHGPQILGAIGGVLGNIGNAVLQHGPELLGAAAEALASLVEWITSNGPTLVTTAVGVVGNLIDAARNWIVTNGPAILEAAATAFGNIATAIMERGPEIMANIGNTIGLAIGYVIDAAPRMLAAAGEFMAGLITGSSEEGQQLHQWFADFFPDGLLQGLGDFATFLLDTGKALIQGLIDGISAVAPDVGGMIQAAFQTVLDFFGGVADFIADPLGTIQGGLTDLVGAFDGTAASAAGNMVSIENSVGASMDSATGALDAYNGNDLENKSTTAKVTGNAVDGTGKRNIDNTKSAIDSLKSKSISVSATGNIVSGIAKSAIGNVKSAIDNLKSKTVTLTTKTVKTGGAWGGINYMASGGVRVASRYGSGVPLDIVGERGPEAVVPLTSRYAQPFTDLIADEVAGRLGQPGQIDYARLGAAVASALTGVEVRLDGRETIGALGRRAATAARMYAGR